MHTWLLLLTNVIFCIRYFFLFTKSKFFSLSFMYRNGTITNWNGTQMIMVVSTHYTYHPNTFGYRISYYTTSEYTTLRIVHIYTFKSISISSDASFTNFELELMKWEEKSSVDPFACLKLLRISKARWLLVDYVLLVLKWSEFCFWIFCSLHIFLWAE